MSELLNKINKKDGSCYVTLHQLAVLFYRSRFNRDNLCDLEEGEDIDDSGLHRIFLKRDIEELFDKFGDFFEWAINAKNMSRIVLTPNVKLIREKKLPRLKLANMFDQVRLPGVAENGKYYITKAKYNWILELTGDAQDKMIEVKEKDPEVIAMRESLLPEMEEKNRNVGKKN